MREAPRVLRWTSRLRPRRRTFPASSHALGEAVTLDTMRRRLELMLAAIYGRPMRIAAARPERPSTWYRRILRPVPRHMREQAGAVALAGCNGTRIELPPTLDAYELDLGPDAAVAYYKLLALEQAERMQRGTSLLVPSDNKPLERDLYLLSESVVVDRALVEATPNLAQAIARERTRALGDRPDMNVLTPAEREMESLVRAVLTAPPGQPAEGIPGAADPAASRAWAVARDRAMRGTTRAYRGLPAVRLWGRVQPLGGGFRGVAEQPWELASANYKFVSEGAGPNQGGSTPHPDGAPPPSPDRPPPVETGKTSEAGESSDHQTGDADSEVARSDTREGTPLSSAEAQADASSQPADDGAPLDASTFDAESRGGAAATGSAADAADDAPGLPYPEWDYLDQQYSPLPAIVHLRAPIVSTQAWAAQALDTYAPVIRRLREKFDKLRARRIRLVRQRDGDELDIPACIEAYVDARTGHAVGDRLYSAVRPARRALAITLLVDISGSTSEKIHGEERVIDVARLALLIVTQALDALGDPYAIVTFSGRGREHVRMRVVKSFDDPSGEVLHQRIGGLAPEGYTRAGAAIRHATTMLMEQPAGQRLLLMLSDGKPNDDGGYAGRYAVEDTRQAILEAQGRGIHPYCLTIDRKGHDYLTRIFGESGHTILQHPAQLPTALADVIRRLLGARA